MWRSTGPLAATAFRTPPFAACEHALTVVDLDPDSDPPKVLAIGADQAGNLLEVIWRELADEVDLVIHAMPLRPTYHSLLPPTREDSP